MIGLSADNVLFFVVWVLVAFVTTSFIAISMARQITSQSQNADKHSVSLRDLAQALWRLFVSDHHTHAKSRWLDRHEGATARKSTQYLFLALIVWIALGLLIFLKW